MRRPQNFNWLILLIVSWALPVYWPASYLFSLLFWALPVVVLLPDYRAATDTATRRRRRALLYATLWIVTLGVVLDFGLGRWVLTFQAPWYLWIIYGIPIEEIFFYILAPAAILLVYGWADERWFSLYNQSTSSPTYVVNGPPLIRFSPRLIALTIALWLAAIALTSWRANEFRVPIYASFLILFAFAPAIATYRAVGHYVNWRAFGATTMYAIGTSLAHEVTLAIPLGWWGYQDDATMGIFVRQWGSSYSRFPLEAAAVWVAAPFSCVLTYEFFKAYTHHPAGTTRQKLGI